MSQKKSDGSSSLSFKAKVFKLYSVYIRPHLPPVNVRTRVLKCVLAQMCAIIYCVSTYEYIGPLVYLTCMMAVFCHPGKRAGAFVESACLVLTGLPLGIAYVLLERHLAQITYPVSIYGAYIILAVFEAIALFLIGYFRSRYPRFFLFLFMIFMMTHFGGMGTALTESPRMITKLFAVPFLMELGTIALINFFIFPELGSDFVGFATLDTLDEVKLVLKSAVALFIHKADENRPTDSSSSNSGVSKMAALASLTAKKPKLRAKHKSCMTSLNECSFEFAYSPLAPTDLKPTVKELGNLVKLSNVLVGACESQYSLFFNPNQDEASISNDEESMDPEDRELAGGDDIAQVNKGNSESDQESFIDPENNSNSPQSGESPGSISPGQKSVDNSPQRADDSRRSSTSHPSLRQSFDSMRTSSMSNLHNFFLRHYGSSSKPSLTRHPNISTQSITDSIRVKKEIEWGDKQLMERLSKSVSQPLLELEQSLAIGIDTIKLSVAYCYDVKSYFKDKKSEYRSLGHRGILGSEVRLHAQSLKEQINRYDSSSRAALADVASKYEEGDVMPSDEVFLLSSFLLNYRDAAKSVLSMLEKVQPMVEERAKRHFKRIWHPIFRVKKWFQIASKGTSDNGEGQEGETALLPTVSPTEEIQARGKESIIERDRKRLVYKLGNIIADTIDFFLHSVHVKYAFRLALSVLVSSFPGFTPSLEAWFRSMRGVWIGFMCFLVNEASIGGSIDIYVLRTIGITVGSSWGYASFVAANWNPYVLTVMCTIGFVASYYVTIGTKYPKAGMVMTIGISTVAMTSYVQPEAGTIKDNFAKRCITMLIGGGIATAFQIILFPRKARVMVGREISHAITECATMEAFISFGIEDKEEMGSNPNITPEIRRLFGKAFKRATSALDRATVFNRMALKEPRLKGSFKGYHLIYKEIIFTVQQIAERMYAVAELRSSYGSDLLKELNSEIYPYRRNLAGSITIVLRALSDSLVTKAPLPQYLPSSRLAHRRLVTKVRQLLLHVAESEKHKTERKLLRRGREKGTNTQNDLLRKIKSKEHETGLRLQVLSWNASSCSLEEVVEYVEELTDLGKILLGVSEFKYGFLSRSLYTDYAAFVARGAQERLKSSDMAGQLPHFIGRNLRKRRQSTKHSQSGVSTNPHARIVRFAPTTEGTDDDEHDTASSVKHHHLADLHSVMKRRLSHAHPKSGNQMDYGDDNHNSIGRLNNEYNDVFDDDNNEDPIPLSLARIQTRREQSRANRQ